MNNKSEIKFFLKSAGSHPNQGYQWWRVQANKALTADEPSFIKELLSAKWLDREAFLLLILRNNQGIHLYVTALVTQGREDFQGRKIRNDLAFTVSPEDESILLDFACALLQEKDRVEKELNQRIRPEKTAGSKSGFTADYNSIIKWIRGFSKPSSRVAPELGSRIAKNSENNRKKLAALLSQQKLPEQPGFLVAVTRFSDPASFLEKPNWWLVLTELEKSPDWRPLYPMQKRLAGLMKIPVITWGVPVAVLLAATIGLGLAIILEPHRFQEADVHAAKSEPAKSEPAKSEPAKSEPAKSEPAKSEHVKSEPAKSEPAKSEPAKSDAGVNKKIDIQPTQSPTAKQQQ